MDFTEEHKDKLKHRLVETIIQGLEQETIDLHDLHPVADTILTKLETVKTKEEADSFLRELAQQWPIFGSVTSVES